MGARSPGWARELDRPVTVGLLIALIAVRFVAATVTAFAGIEGMDTRGLDAAFELYSDLLLLLLFLVVGLRIAACGPSLWRRWGFLVFLVSAVAEVALWLGTVNPATRILRGNLGAWSDFATGMAAVVALTAFAWTLLVWLRGSGAPRAGLDGFRMLALGFGTALALRSIRLLDFPYLFGWALPSGVLWTLDFGPALILAALAVAGWARFAWHSASPARERLVLAGIPLTVAIVALAAALGVLGGFIASNALAWGGSYTVFAPTSVSLPLVGFGVGAFLGTAWVAGRRLPDRASWLLFGGVAVAAFAGIQTSAGTLASFAGLLTGYVTTARGASVCAPSHIE